MMTCTVIAGRNDRSNPYKLMRLLRPDEKSVLAMTDKSCAQAKSLSPGEGFRVRLSSPEMGIVAFIF